MKSFIKIVLLSTVTSFLMFSISFAEDVPQFNFLKLSPKLEERAKAIYSGEKNALLKIKIDSLSANFNKVAAIDIPDHIDLGPEDSPIYDRILKAIENYKSIGERESSNLINYNRGNALGKINYSGFTWTKPVGNFHIGVDRQVSHNLLSTGPDNAFFITDRFSIIVDAYTLLERAVEAGDIAKIPSTDLKLFAGLMFRRDYTYIHYAKSYQKGITSDFTKLFLCFMRFRGSAFNDISPYEIIKREDTLLFQAGGMVTGVPTTGINFQAGVFVEGNRYNQAIIQMVGARDNPKPHEFSRVSIKRSKALSAGVDVRVIADFFGLLRITLFAYDFTYELDKGNEVLFSFQDSDRSTLEDKNSSLSKELKRAFSYKEIEYQHLAPYITSKTVREKENRQSLMRFFLIETVKKRATEQVRIEKNGKVTTFFKNYNENQKIVRNFWSDLFNSFFRALFNINNVAKIKASKTRITNIEYKMSEAAINKNNTQNANLFIENDSDISLEMTQEYNAQKVRGRGNRIYKKHAQTMLRNYTNLPRSINNELSRDKIKGPVKLRSAVRIQGVGIKHFNSMSEKNFFKGLVKLCKSRRWYRWKSSSYRKRYVKRIYFFDSKAERCVKKIGRKYMSYKKIYNRNRAIPYNEFKELIITLHKKINKKSELRAFFGGGLFMHGDMTARKFKTFYKEGTFRGLGVIDNFLRSDGINAPAFIK